MILRYRHQKTLFGLQFFQLIKSYIFITKNEKNSYRKRLGEGLFGDTVVVSCKMKIEKKNKNRICFSQSSWLDTFLALAASSRIYIFSANQLSSPSLDYTIDRKAAAGTSVTSRRKIEQIWKPWRDRIKSQICILSPRPAASVVEF